MTSKDTRLRVAIVGSGIAGLAAARILREKHDVTVYERGEPSVATGGQGIANFPNSTHILESMGFDYKRVGSVELDGWNSVDKHGKYLHSIDYNMRERYGAPLVSHLRMDFRTELWSSEAGYCPAGDLGLDASTTPATTLWNNGAVNLDPKDGLVTLEDGVRDSPEILVADGIHSRLRNKILREPISAQKTGLTCCRVTVSAERVEQALEHRVADQVKLWELRDLEPLPTWTSGRAVLIGDAAHAMTPMQGQGSNMATEDADDLRLLTQPGVTRDSVPEVLNVVESVRRPRARRCSRIRELRPISPARLIDMRNSMKTAHTPAYWASSSNKPQRPEFGEHISRGTIATFMLRNPPSYLPH
ncbi:hypothetical protein GQX73_g904 [Xylaria multiplex]|uniref:FAD-binding domain-containing protein n=1 Tax=Xylaria multiplex TaxID=323545 RepID=A0A7C8IWY0_9PEZI|nr:hypothetical protein GQX73_g904 [Xylaria multiplex]